MHQMIKGIDVKLHENGSATTVKNVLVGEPSQSAGSLSYTLAIPKGDNHDWTDKKMEFFGRQFRTTGFPVQGIDENIPLFWNKKITAELLKINGDCTIYEKNTFARHVFHDVYFYDQRGETNTKTGARKAGEVNVLIYSVNCTDTEYSPKIGDILVCRACPFEFDASSEKAVSESMTEFRELYPKFSTIISVKHSLNGIKFDYEITAR